MAFENLKDLLVWFAKSQTILNRLKETREYDPSCALTRMLEGFVSFYDPRLLISEQKLMAIYRRLYGLEDGDDEFDISESFDLERFTENISIDDCDGVEELTRAYKDSGRIAKTIGITEMCNILGYHPVTLRNLLRKNPPPIQYGWRRMCSNGVGWWRFSVEQIDNFKRWLANNGHYPEQPREIEPMRSVHEAEGESLPKNLRGNVYEIEDAEYSCPAGDF